MQMANIHFDFVVSEAEAETIFDALCKRQSDYLVHLRKLVLSNDNNITEKDINNYIEFIENLIKKMHHHKEES